VILSYLLAFLLVLVGSDDLENQSVKSTVRDDHPIGISVVGGGVCFGGLSLDVFLSNSFNIELSGGWGFGGGLKYHWNGTDPSCKWSPYVGAYAAAIPEIIIFSSESEDWGTSIYFPIGVHYISWSGFSFSIDGGYMNAYGASHPMASVKVGWHF